VGSPIGSQRNPVALWEPLNSAVPIGLHALELGWVQSVRVNESTCAAIKSMGEEQGVSLSVHAPYFINLNATAKSGQVTQTV